MDYAAIKALVTFYMHRDDLAPYMDSFFELGRQRISNDARLLCMEITTNYVMTTPYQDLPADFIEARNVVVNVNGARRPLRFYTKAALDALTSRSTTTPLGYTINAGQIEVRPTAGDVDLDLTYYARPSVLVNDTDTNDVLTNFPSLYLYIVMMFASNSVHDTETEDVSATNYDTELARANDSEQSGRYSGDAPTIVGA